MEEFIEEKPKDEASGGVHNEASRKEELKKQQEEVDAKQRLEISGFNDEYQQLLNVSFFKLLLDFRLKI